MLCIKVDNNHAKRDIALVKECTGIETYCIKNEHQYMLLGKVVEKRRKASTYCGKIDITKFN